MKQPKIVFAGGSVLLATWAMLVDQSASLQLENFLPSALSHLDRMAKGQDAGSGLLKSKTADMRKRIKTQGR